VKTLVANLFKVRCCAKVGPPVVGTNTINMIEHSWRLFTGRQLPRNPMRLKWDFINNDDTITKFVNIAGDCSGVHRITPIATAKVSKVLTRPFLPRQLPSLRIIVEALPQIVH